jgi:RNA polymerase sigma factor (sigma-70 family)
MQPNLTASHSDDFQHAFERQWQEWYPRFQTSVRCMLRTYFVPYWYGQEEEMVEDIIQETIRRTLERAERVARNEVQPVRQLEPMMLTIARNYCIDLGRREYRLTHFPTGEIANLYQLSEYRDVADLAERATEAVYQENLFSLLAQEVSKFPRKQQQVLLSDLARRMAFEEHLTPLQQAFLNVGIQMQDYLKFLPTNEGEYKRYAALLHHAYKRVAHLSILQSYLKESA